MGLFRDLVLKRDSAFARGLLVGIAIFRIFASRGEAI